MKRRKDREHELIYEFIAQKRINGKWEIEVPIPDKILRKTFEHENIVVRRCARVMGYRIDAVCTGKETWLIEAKNELVLAALGQLLGYRFLYSEWKGISENDIHLGIICKRVRKALVPIFEKYGIKIFKV